MIRSIYIGAGHVLDDEDYTFEREEFVIVREGAEIGGFKLDEFPDHTVFHSFWIHEHFRGKGYSREVMDFIIQQSNDACKRVRLWCYRDNARAVHIYTKYGFHEDNAKGWLSMGGAFKTMYMERSINA